MSLTNNSKEGVFLCLEVGFHLTTCDFLEEYCPLCREALLKLLIKYDMCVLLIK